MQIQLLLDQYAAYDLWANALFVKRLDRESSEVLDRTTPSSYPSLRTTLLHVRDAHHTWWSRLVGKEARWPAEEDQAIGTLLKHAALLRDLVAGMQEKDLIREMNYTDLRGITHRQPAWQMLMHCFNHASYHRGQVVSIMRTLGLEEVPHTDLVVFQRSLKRPAKP
ncbi:MAG: DinB family protein [Flavobacteriales bacterium]|nr:DinB family protein [Flavobacteriales bacterium]MCB9167634.1 DinB family protein [Flavobacteriales bacterium]